MKMYFLSGLPRTGTTALAAILNQNPEIYCSKTSPISKLFRDTALNIDEYKNFHEFPHNFERDHLISSLNLYHKTNKKYIIDRSKVWPQNINRLKSIGIEPKIICMLRPVEEILVSLYRLKPAEMGDLYASISGHIVYIKNALLNHKENIHVIEYDDLINTPNNVMEGLYSFMGFNYFEHDFNNIDDSVVKENDIKHWGIPGLHSVRKKLEKTSLDPKEVMFSDMLKHFKEFNFYHKGKLID